MLAPPRELAPPPRGNPGSATDLYQVFEAISHHCYVVTPGGRQFEKELWDCHVDPREHDYIAFDEYYNEPIGRSFGNCDIYNTTITWLRKHDHMARYFPIFLVFGAKFQYFDNGE